MVVRRTIHHLRERPKDERAAIAGSIAVGVVAILFIGWGIYFFHTIQSGAATTNIQQAASDQYDSSGLQQAQQQLQQGYASTSQAFIDMQNQAAQEQAQLQASSSNSDQTGDSNY